MVDIVSNIFSGEMPPAWTTASFRNRLAQAEFTAATDPSQRIPEPRLAAAWNRYARNIDAPREILVTSPELHNLRDALHISAHLLWGIHQQIWTVPGIYATEPDGTLAASCRPLESIRIFWDLASQIEILRAACQRTQQGILASEQFKQQGSHPPSAITHSQITFGRVSESPVETAGRRYLSQHGSSAFAQMMEELLSSLFSLSV